MQVFLETQRLVLRRFTAADADILVSLDADPDVMRFVTGGIPTSRDEIEKEILPAFLHLKVLEHAGLVSRSRRATARLSRLEAGPLREVTTWLARYQRFWDESHERLDELLAALLAAQEDNGPPEQGGDSEGNHDE
jgi:RimJ/RimL family protein N-acetyltransferase